MARTTKRGAIGVVRAIGVGVVALVSSLALAGMPVAAQEAPTFDIWDFGVVPRPSLQSVLLSMDAVQQELKITDAQKKEQAAIEGRQSSRIQQARRENKDRAKFLAARKAILNEIAAAFQATMKPEQRERLDQIQLQAQGPLAFARPEFEPMEFVGPPVAERLKLSEDQARKVRAIVETGDKEIAKAASFPIVMDTKEKPTAESIRKLVEGPEFRAAKEKTRHTARAAWDAVIHRIEEVLSDEQRANYRKMLGAPFDLSKLQFDRGVSPTEDDVETVAQALGLGGGQRADPNFNVKVAHPAYAGDRSAPHPRVLIDEAHGNFHTADGRYKPFADLVANDGYRVGPNKEKFTRSALEKGDILVIANASGADEPGSDGETSQSAFTEAECDAVRDWVKDGGSLLLITDHAPFGSAAQALSKRFGVHMSTGTAADPSHSQDGETCLVFARKDNLLGDHPITRGRDASEQVNRIMTFTGQSLKGPEGSVPILKLADTAYDSSIGDGKPGAAAGRSQGVALAFGKGRVVVLGEAAELSAQVYGLSGQMGMNVPGIDNRQMALNIVRWLSGLLEPRETALKKAG